MSPSPRHYDTDFYAWTQHQAALLREEKWQALDYANLAEELESLGKSQYHTLENRLAVLVRHLLKWHYQPEKRQRGRSWRSTIWEQRSRLRRLLRQSPSLRPQVPAILAEEYPSIRRWTLEETDLPPIALPESCPWTVDQILDESFWPESAAPQEERNTPNGQVDKG
jgi:hypothetical protein